MEMCGHSVIQLWQLAWPDWLDKTNEKEAKNNLNVSKVWVGSIVIGMQRRCIHNTNNASLIRLWNPGKYDRIAQVADIISANLNLNLCSEWHTDGPDIRRQEKSHLLFVTIRQLSQVWNYQAGNTNCIWPDTLHGHVVTIKVYSL